MNKFRIIEILEEAGIEHQGYHYIFLQDIDKIKTEYIRNNDSGKSKRQSPEKAIKSVFCYEHEIKSLNQDISVFLDKSKFLEVITLTPSEVFYNFSTPCPKW